MPIIKVAGSFSGKISTGSFENANPGFFAEVTYDAPDDDPEALKRLIVAEQKMLHEICYNNFKESEQQAIVERITKERKSFKFYPQPNGKKAPSVTSVINFDADWHITEDELQQYASQGSITHAQISKYWETKSWVEPKEIKEILTDLIILHKGSLKLRPLEYNFEGFLKKYPFEVKSYDRTVHNEEHRYSGTLDYEGLSIETVGKVPTICDAKRTVDKHKAFMQMAAYANCKGLEHIKQLMAIPVNCDNAQGFSKPVVTTDLEKYFQMFLDKRRDFQKRYQI